MSRRWLFYLVINVLVSAATMLTILYLWDQSKKAASMELPALTGTPPNRETWTPAPPATPTPFIYIVKPGDTLGAIAATFGVDLEELAAINKLVSPYDLMPDMKLVIPPKAQTSSYVSDHPTITPQQGEPFPWPFLDWVASPSILELEVLRIGNNGPSADMTGWKILSPRGAEYVFPTFSLMTRGAVELHTGKGTDTSIDLYWGLDAAVWQSGDEVQLLDAQSNLRAVLLIP